MTEAGERTHITTKVSHTKKWKQIDAGLFSDMARQVLVWFETHVQPHFPLVGARLQTGQADIDFEQLGLLRLVRLSPRRLPL